MKKIFWLLLCVAISPWAQAQNDSTMIRRIYDRALVHGHAYENLRELCKDVGHRLSGSENAEKAVEWAVNKLLTYDFDSVRLEPVMVPKWVRGNPERCEIVEDGTRLDVLALGFSVGTDGELSGEVALFPTLDALRAAPEGSLTGKIAFVNEPLDPTIINTFVAYSSCSSSRVRGASVAAEKGAVAYVMRSLGLSQDDFPRTGVMYYSADADTIPAFALSTNSATLLAERIEKGETVTLVLESDCKTLPDVLSYNVIAEIVGTEHPNKIITVGGHLDSWDVGEGAHDDGVGVIQSLEVLKIFKDLGIKPRHTLRCVFFMNEENGVRGGIAYAESCEDRGETHLAAMESDRGGYTPRGFSVDAPTSTVDYFADWLPHFRPYDIHLMVQGFAGVDINPLKKFGSPPLLGYLPDSQRYFDVHHSANDVFERVNKRELELGAAGMASMIYMIDKYGVPNPGHFHH